MTRASDLFTPEEILEVKEFINLFDGGILTRVWDKDGILIYENIA